MIQLEELTSNGNLLSMVLEIDFSKDDDQGLALGEYIKSVEFEGQLKKTGYALKSFLEDKKNKGLYHIHLIREKNRYA